VKLIGIACEYCVDVAANTKWFKYDRDYLCVNKSQFVPVIFEPPCIINISKCECFTKLLHLLKKKYKQNLQKLVEILRRFYSFAAT
jgi:hypothetical protein